MRLIYTKTLELHEFFGLDVPHYAILSHTWGAGEVSFQEMQTDAAQLKAGYSKIRRCCEMAAADGFLYAWVDTCCIDETSSAELSEAINSMYKWYQMAGVCYVYLADVSASVGRHTAYETIHQVLRKSRWFTRGWTLQELIAPDSVILFNKDWEELGTKQSLEAAISNITGIDTRALQDARSMPEFSVAQKMFWASKRATTRKEDIAYCLLGIFDVNMPMLYGEDSHAFIRLQEEIMKNTADHSIFAWDENYGSGSGLLAPIPAAFRSSENIIQRHNPAASPFSLTNKGINLTLKMKALKQPKYCLVILDCQRRDNPTRHLGIYLERQYPYHENLCGRLSVENLAVVDEVEASKLKSENIFVTGKDKLLASSPSFHGYSIITRELEARGVSLLESYPYPPSCRGDDIVFIWPDDLFSRDFPAHRFHAFRFYDKQGDGFDFLLEHQHWVRSKVSASITEATRCPLKDICLTLEKKEQLYFKVWEGKNGDRVTWKHPIKKWWISVEIKRNIISENPMHVVRIDWHPPPRIDVAIKH